MTDNHRKDLFSRAFVRAMSAPLGFNPVEPTIDNDSIDISFTAKGFDGHLKRNPQINFQLKCTEKPPKKGVLSFPLKKKNYNDLSGADLSSPSYLIVVCVPKDMSQWVTIGQAEMILRNNAYWYSLYGLPALTKNSFTLSIPIIQQFTQAVFQNMMVMASDGGHL